MDYKLPTINIKNTGILFVVPTPSILRSVAIDITPKTYTVEVLQDLVFFLVPEFTCLAALWHSFANGICRYYSGSAS